MFTRIKKKLNNIAGTSLAELLMVVLIISLASAALVGAVSLAYRQYSNSLRYSAANTLSSTIMTVITNELAYTQEIKVDGSGNVTQFLSQNYTIQNNRSTFMTDQEGLNGYGHIELGNSADTTESRKILGDAAYTNHLLAKVESVTYDGTNHCFTVTVSIGFNGNEIKRNTFQVRNVNEKVLKILM